MAFTDDNDIARQMRLLYMRSNVFLREFAQCSFDVKCHLFKSYCIAFYCPFLWMNFSKQSMCHLRIAFNNVHRKLLNYGRRDSASQMFVSNNMSNFDSILRRCIYGFIQRLQRSSNYLILTLLSCWQIRYGAMWRFWNSSLYAFSFT